MAKNTFLKDVVKDRANEEVPHLWVNGVVVR